MNINQSEFRPVRTFEKSSSRLFMWVIASLLLARLELSAQPAATQPAVEIYSEVISAADLMDNLNILADDALEGRETGSRGQKMAAAFIRHHFEELGLSGPVNGSYYQPFDLYKSVQGEVYLKTGGRRYENFQDIVYYGKDDSNGEISLPVVFAGKGRAEDLAQLDVKGKGVLVITGAKEDYRSAVSRARTAGAAMIFIANMQSADAIREYTKQVRNLLADSRLSLSKDIGANQSKGVFFVSPEVAAKMLEISSDKLASVAAQDVNVQPLKKLRAGKVTYKTTLETKTVKSENVLGYLEGTDKKDELLIITAHYDHIGKKASGTGDLINNGADDDGSGTVAVMQLAKAFAQAKEEGNGPRRSILFMTVAAEEHGLLGSEYYTRHPVLPLSNTVVNLNIDMIGRRDEQHRQSPPYVYVIGSDKLSSELHELSESVNNKYMKLVFDYTYNDENHPARLYYRSDHWNFAQKNIPIIFYFDGIHEDYHLPSDEVDKIEFDLLTARTKAIFYTAWEIANRDKKILPDKKQQ